MGDKEMLISTLLIIGIVLCISQFLPMFRKQKWILAVAIILIGIGSILHVFFTNNEGYESLESSNYITNITNINEDELESNYYNLI